MLFRRLFRKQKGAYLDFISSDVARCDKPPPYFFNCLHVCGRIPRAQANALPAMPPPTMTTSYCSGATLLAEVEEEEENRTEDMEAMRAPDQRWCGTSEDERVQNALAVVAVAVVAVERTTEAKCASMPVVIGDGCVCVCECVDPV